ETGMPGGLPFHPPDYAGVGGYAYHQDRIIGWAGNEIRGDALAFQAMDALQNDPNRFFPFQGLGLDGERSIVLGKVYVLANRPGAVPLIPSPLPEGSFPVKVTEVTPTSFTFTTLEGHFDPPGSIVTFSIRSDASGAIHLEHDAITARDRSGASLSLLVAP